MWHMHGLTNMQMLTHTCTAWTNAWMIHVCHCSSSLESCMMMSHWILHRQKIPPKIWETIASTEEDELHFMLEKCYDLSWERQEQPWYRLPWFLTAVSNKGRLRSTMNERQKEKGTVTDKEASIIHISCVCVWRMQLYIQTRHKPQQVLVVFSGPGLFPQRFSLLRHKNSFNSTLSKCTNKALGGCCNYFSGFCPGYAANFPHGSPKIGGKPELSLTISPIPSSIQAFVHFIYIRTSKGTNVPHLNIDYKPPSYSCNLPHTHTHNLHFRALYFTIYACFYMLNTILPKLQGKMVSIYINIC